MTTTYGNPAAAAMPDPHWRTRDIVVASVKAYLSALNKLESKVERVSAQG